MTRTRPGMASSWLTWDLELRLKELSRPACGDNEQLGSVQVTVTANMKVNAGLGKRRKATKARLLEHIMFCNVSGPSPLIELDWVDLCTKRVAMSRSQLQDAVSAAAASCGCHHDGNFKSSQNFVRERTQPQPQAASHGA